MFQELRNAYRNEVKMVDNKLEKLGPPPSEYGSWLRWKEKKVRLLRQEQKRLKNKYAPLFKSARKAQDQIDVIEKIVWDLNRKEISWAESMWGDR